MPGASLWLLPPANSSVEDILSQLILKTVPSHFPELKDPPQFPPHLTLTSDIPVDIAKNEPQKWLDALPLTGLEPPSVSFQSLDIGPQFFKKVTLGVSKAPLRSLAARVRAFAVEKGDQTAADHWVTETYAPHVSLMYADLEIDSGERCKILHDVKSSRVWLAKEEPVETYGKSEGETHKGWSEGRIVLVSTWQDLKEWTVVAERSL